MRRLLQDGVYYTFPFSNGGLLEGSVYKRAAFKRGNTVRLSFVNYFLRIKIILLKVMFFESLLPWQQRKYELRFSLQHNKLEFGTQI